MLMKLSDCFVMEAFNELINFPFEDVRVAFNQFDCYVAMGKEESFVKEVVHIKNWYSEELEKIEKYTQEEYTSLMQTFIDKNALYSVIFSFAYLRNQGAFCKA